MQVFRPPQILVSMITFKANVRKPEAILSPSTATMKPSLSQLSGCCFTRANILGFIPNPPNSGPLFYFIGLSRPSGTSWANGARWQDRSPVDYTHWDAWAPTRQPDGLQTDLYSAIVLNGAQPGGTDQLTAGYWHEVWVTGQYPGLCERPICVAPSTAAAQAKTKA
jgi:hypothetical protein